MALEVVVTVLADVLRDNAERYELNAADEADNAGHAGPAGDGLAAERRNERPEATHKADKSNDDAEGHNKL